MGLWSAIGDLFSPAQEQLLYSTVSDEEFTRLFRELDDVSHIDALEILEAWEIRATLLGWGADAHRRIRACQVVLGLPERRVYR